MAPHRTTSRPPSLRRSNPGKRPRAMTDNDRIGDRVDFSSPRSTHRVKGGARRAASTSNREDDEMTTTSDRDVMQIGTAGKAASPPRRRGS